MLSEELLKKIKKLRIITWHQATELAAGSYHSAFKGQGLEFEEVREYLPGDDVRNIDWNVSARAGRPFIKIFREERELTVFFLVDVSASTCYGLNVLKKDLIAELCAVLGFSAVSNHDKIGVILFSDHIEKYVPPRKGRQATTRILREILSHEPHYGKTDIRMALEFLGRVHRKKSIVFLISDFLTGGYEKQLSMIGTRNDLIGIMVHDELEKDPPLDGLMPVRDIETGAIQFADFSDPLFRKGLVAGLHSQQEQTRQMFRRLGLDLISIDTREDYLRKILQLFRAREKRR